MNESEETEYKPSPLPLPATRIQQALPNSKPISVGRPG